MNIKDKAYIGLLKIRMRFVGIMQKSYMNAVAYSVGFLLLIWFVLYPEFSLTTETYRVLDENGQVAECNLTADELRIEIMEADKDEIVFKSKLWEMISEWGRSMKDGKVKIKITGWQTTGHESDTVEAEAEGTYEKVGDGCRLRYIEEAAEGMKVENEVTASLKKAVVSKKGAIRSEMVFVPGEENTIAYQTPFGTIDMKTKCDSISCYEDETEAHVMISYSLYSGEQMVAYCKTLLEVSPV